MQEEEEFDYQQTLSMIKERLSSRGILTWRLFIEGKSNIGDSPFPLQKKRHAILVREMEIAEGSHGTFIWRPSNSDKLIVVTKDVGKLQEKLLRLRKELSHFDYLQEATPEEVTRYIEEQSAKRIGVDWRTESMLPEDYYAG